MDEKVKLPSLTQIEKLDINTERAARPGKD